MENRVTFGRRGLPRKADPPETPWLAATSALSGNVPPYMAPHAFDERPFSVIPVLEESRVLTMMFSAQGRMSRVRYCVLSLVSALTYVVALIALRLTLPPVAASLLILPLTVAFLWNYIAIRIKRWHDRDKSGWWCLLGLLPVVGWVWTVVECRYLSGTRGPNRFGEDPRSKVYLSEVFA